jgi:hypothetical protein
MELKLVLGKSAWNRGRQLDALFHYYHFIVHTSSGQQLTTHP